MPNSGYTSVMKNVFQIQWCLMVVITNTIDYNIAQGVNVSLTFASVLLTTPPNNLPCTHLSRQSISVSTAIPYNLSCFPTISLFKGEAFANIPKFCNIVLKNVFHFVRLSNGCDDEGE